MSTSKKARRQFLQRLAATSVIGAGGISLLIQNALANGKDPLAALAYTLMINLRQLALAGTELAQACTATIRTRLLKIGAAVVRNTRRVRVLLASAHPMKDVFLAAARALSP